MKRNWNAFWMCQSMFCAIPCPVHTWDEEARPRMLLFLPLVGLEMGALWAGLGWLCGLLALPPLVRGIVLSTFPYLVSGWIHLDGFMDVCDAVGSCRSLERRREILKDSHVGSFAVFGVVRVMMTQFALCASGEGDYRMLLFIPVVSRCCSALAVTVLRPMSTSQYAGAFREGIPKGQIGVLAVVMAVAVTAAVLLCGRSAIALVGGLAGYGWALRKGFRSLDGMNGDISGFALTVSELGALAVWALV